MNAQVFIPMPHTYMEIKKWKINPPYCKFLGILLESLKDLFCMYILMS